MKIMFMPKKKTNQTAKKMEKPNTILSLASKHCVIITTIEIAHSIIPNHAIIRTPVLRLQQRQLSTLGSSIDRLLIKNDKFD